jgi:hypothetical protein
MSRTSASTEPWTSCAASTRSWKRLDRRVEHLEREMTVVRAGMEEVTQAVPELGKGPLEKARDALSGGD